MYTLHCRSQQALLRSNVKFIRSQRTQILSHIRTRDGAIMTTLQGNVWVSGGWRRSYTLCSRETTQYAYSAMWCRGDAQIPTRQPRSTPASHTCALIAHRSLEPGSTATQTPLAVVITAEIRQYVDTITRNGDVALVVVVGGVVLSVAWDANPNNNLHGFIC